MIATAQKPFVHAFAHGGRWYAYDVNTNGLLEVDAVLGRVLAALVADQPAREFERRSAELGGEAVEAALAEIEKARRDEGVFRSHRPRIIPSRNTAADRAAYESKLSHLILTVTEDCNLACGYCPQAAKRASPVAAKPRHMSQAIALQALTYFAEHCHGAESPAVSFYGGEPLLRPDLITEVINLARSRRDWPQLRFVIDTNGTLIDDAVADLIAREGIFLQISLDGPAPIHDRWRVFRDGRGSHVAVLAGLERVLRREPSAAERIAFQVTGAPPVDLGVRAQSFQDFSPYRHLSPARQPNLRFSLADLSWNGDSLPCHGAPAQQQVSVAQARWLEACAHDRRPELDPLTRRLFDTEVIRFHHRSRAPLPEVFVPGGCCQPGLRRLVVDPDGQYRPCERMGPEFTIGDVESGIDAGHVADLAADFDRALGERCRECWAVRLCDLCYVSLAREDEQGELILREEVCSRARQRAASMLAIYADLLACEASAAEFLRDTSLI